MDRCPSAVEWITMEYILAMYSALTKKEILSFGYTELF